MLGNRLVIGLDFGTTYTGVSFCETSDTSASQVGIQIVQDWPASHTRIGTAEKVPSEVAYLTDGSIEWGAKIPPHAQRYIWTKLELDRPKSGEAETIRQEIAALGGDMRHPVTITSDLLAKVKDHLILNLDREYGKELWRTLPITLVVTVPAVWSDAAKDRTLQAVSQAGFNQREFPQLKRTVTTTEPEAAALYTIQSLAGSVKDDQMEIGDGFVVCDMGGGTVDLISYRVVGTEPTSIEEATVGTGDQCGGSFVDRAFMQWLEDKLGVDEFLKVANSPAHTLPRTSLPPKLAKMIQKFTFGAKYSFSGTEEYYLELPNPWNSIDDEMNGIADGEIYLSASDMREFFAIPLRRTKELLVEQLHELKTQNKNVAAKYVFMVGGFAESPYMYRQVSAMAPAMGGIQVVKPAFAWSAIARGATVKGLESDGRTAIKFRKCRRHYGTACTNAFLSGVHREVDSYICPFTGEKRASNQMSWLVHTGQELSTSADVHATVHFHQNWFAGERRVKNLQLLASEQGKAPLRNDNNVFKVAELSIDLGVVPESEFQAYRSPTGRIYHRLEFEVQISIQSVLEYSFMVKGIKYGSLTASYA